MDPQDRFYELKIQETVIKKYLEETILKSENDIQIARENSDQIVYKIATRIYKESGHKIEFKSIKVLLDERMNSLSAQLTYNDKFNKANLIAEKQENLHGYRKAEIFSKLNILISDELSIEQDQVKLDSHFYSDLNLDVVDFIGLMMEVEEAFDVEVTDEAVNKIYFVEDLLSYLHGKV
jgi:acyl carrier protein